jgi:hypothetical protein
MTPEISQRLVRRTLLFTLALSLLANIGHTLLADSRVPVWLRMIGAVAWPILVFLGVDITVKVAWDAISGRRGGIWLARLLILIPGVPAGITSYEHMHAVLLAMGERPFIAAIGPGAVDLMMIGCTITLVLLQRSAGTAQDFVTPKVIPPGAGVWEQMIKQYEEAARENPIEQERKVQQPRRPRPASGDQAKAIELMLAGKADAAVEGVMMGASTMRRYQRAWRILQANPAAFPDAAACATEKVRPELIEQIRDAVTLKAEVA